MIEFPPIVIICGHYGCGKTNLSLNIAVAMSKHGKNVTLADLDIVNPYFRSSDYDKLLDVYNIRLISPKFAGSTLDAPAISGEVASLFVQGNQNSFAVIDVGGDPVGATVLGRFAPEIKRLNYEMLYVINKNRPMTADSSDAAALLTEIEDVSRLKATGVVNNTHLMSDTTRETIVGSMRFARETAARLELPLVMTTAPKEIAPTLKQKNIFPVEIYVRTPW